jgi:hypothetical protein
MKPAFVCCLQFAVSLCTNDAMNSLHSNAQDLITDLIPMLRLVYTHDYEKCCLCFCEKFPQPPQIFTAAYCVK